MSIEVMMPALSPTMEKGTLAKWLVSVGDQVKAGDLLAEIETDKATMEFEAIDDGVIASIVVPEGSEDVPVGAVIALIAAEGEAVSPPEKQTAKAEPAPAPSPEPAPVPVAAAPATAPVEKAAPAAAAPAAAPARSDVRATPLAHRLAAARGIDLSTVKGTGAGGKIVKADVIGADVVPTIGGAIAAPAAQPVQIAEAFAPPPEGVPHAAEKLSSMRKTIARRLTQSKQSVPHFYLSVDVRLDRLLELRAALNADLAASGVKLSVNDMLIRALGVALTEVSDANVQFGGDTLYRFERVDISMAVAIPGGLITPVIRDVAGKSLSRIAREAKDMAAKARDGKLTPEDYTGGTASISNLGMFGIKEMVPVINPPQAMILGIGTGEQRPYVIDGALGIATVMTATGSFDHRAIDGATGAALMAAFKRIVEQPMTLLA